MITDKSPAQGAAVVGDITAEPLLRRYASLIENVAGLPTRTLVVDTGDPLQIEAEFRGLSSEVGAVPRPELTCRA